MYNFCYTSCKAMKNKNIHFFRDHSFSCILVLLIIVAGFFSYHRFITTSDYIVGYQGVCDPARGKCFKSCEDDACTKADYYSEMQKYAPDLYKECGKDITDCATASVCLPSDRKCSITYCNNRTSDDDNVCQEPLETPSSGTQSNNQIDPINNTNDTNI